MLGFVPVGNTWGSSVQCNMMRGNVTAYGMLDYGYDEAYSLSIIWKHASIALGGPRAIILFFINPLQKNQNSINYCIQGV